MLLFPNRSPVLVCSMFSGGTIRGLRRVGLCAKAQNLQSSQDIGNLVQLLLGTEIQTVTPFTRELESLNIESLKAKGYDPSTFVIGAGLKSGRKPGEAAREHLDTIRPLANAANRLLAAPSTPLCSFVCKPPCLNHQKPGSLLCEFHKKLRAETNKAGESRTENDCFCNKCLIKPCPTKRDGQIPFINKQCCYCSKGYCKKGPQTRTKIDGVLRKVSEGEILK